MSIINDTSQSNEFLYEETIKNKLYNLYILINPKLSTTNKNEINLSISTIDDLIQILKNSIEYLLSIINNNNYSQNQLQLENHIIKLESDIRYYMKKEFQFKIQKDALEMKIRAYMGIEDEYEILKEKVRYEGGKFLNNDRKDNEIIILRQENSLLKKDIIKYERKNKELNDIINKNEDIINTLKYKNTQLSKLIEELKNIKNNNIHNIHNNSSINLNIINNNNGNKNNSIIINSNKKYYNKTLTKKYIETLSKNYKNNQFKQKLTLYNSPKITYQFDTNNKNKIDINNNKNKNKITNTIDNNKLFITTYNKIFNNNNNSTSNKYRNKKFKGSSISMRIEDNEKSDLINKYLSINSSNSKYMSSIKTKSYNKINKSIPKYKMPLSNKNESFLNNYGSIRRSVSKKTYRKENHFNEHASFILKRVSKNKNKKNII